VQTDVLGTPYERHTIELRPDGEGEVFATLVSRRSAAPTGAAVLYVHGFVDYFFQTHLADFYVERGIDFYALDLRKYGRSLADHHTPNYCTSLSDYYEEIDAAVRIIRETDGHDRLLINGHSTGGLTASLYAHDRRDAGTVDALFLNSAFLDLNEPWLMRELATPMLVRAGARTKLRGALPTVYGHSIHNTVNGVWDYDLKWKPFAGFPVLAGWLRAIHAGQRRVHTGLDVRVPILSAASTASYRGTKWAEIARSSDSVLDADAIARWSPRLGRNVTVLRVENGLHDLTLSAEPARTVMFDELDRWLTAYFR
jgi:alpha-beta hydrolase superfamily lysophospholipase